jgi:hypothetical protein
MQELSCARIASQMNTQSNGLKGTAMRTSADLTLHQAFLEGIGNTDPGQLLAVRLHKKPSCLGRGAKPVQDAAHLRALDRCGVNGNAKGLQYIVGSQVGGAGTVRQLQDFLLPTVDPFDRFLAGSNGLAGVSEKFHLALVQ